MAEVLRYSNTEVTCYCTIKLDSGETVMISIATFPGLSVIVKRMRIAGAIPVGTIWEFDRTKAGSEAAVAARLFEMFIPGNDPEKHLLDAIRDLLMECRSMKEVADTLSLVEYLSPEIRRASGGNTWVGPNGVLRVMGTSVGDRPPRWGEVYELRFGRR